MKTDTHWNLSVSVEPTFEPLTLGQVKEWLRGKGYTDEDATIIRLIASVRAQYERDNGLALATQTIVQKMDRFPCEVLLYRWPVQSITSIQYLDADGATQTLDSADYQADLASCPARIKPAYGESWPTTRDQWNAVTVTFVAGYTEGLAPYEDQQNLLEIIARRYEKRGDEAWDGPDPVSPNRLWVF